MVNAPATPVISRPQAIGIARAGAFPMYGNYLHTLVLEMTLHDDGWHLKYSPRRDGYRTGGGPHYQIDATTGEIVSKRYYQ